jgi:endonuclease G
MAESTVSELALLRSFNDSILSTDPKMAAERADRSPVITEASSPEGIDRQVQRESIILRRERPVLAIRDNKPDLSDFRDKAESEVWEDILKKADGFLQTASRAVGRIDLTGGRLNWVGTGWVITKNLIVTNRHVAEEFVRSKGDEFVFRTGIDGPIEADVDFIHETGSDDSLVFKLIRPVHVEPEPGPDVAFFEIEQKSGGYDLAAPIPLATSLVASKNVATIGYPAYDSRIPEPDLMNRIFGKLYDKKRLSPGAVTKVDEVILSHNCTTLGGNSGSVVLDLDSGRALGLHFSGSFLKSNYAVRADVVQKILSDIKRGSRRREVISNSAPPAAAKSMSLTAQTVGQQTSVSLTVPLKITVSVAIDGMQSPAVAAKVQSGVPMRAASAAGPDIEGEEAVVADYDDRKGYQSDFLGKAFAVDLPEVRRDADDVLAFQGKNGRDTVLRYEHYSVVMSRSRRMCFFSAVNIDGKLSKKNGRAGWKWDPRIPKAQQIMNECYGNPPKFSRGHMTRREDPGWGKNAETAKRGNEDSMHVTNTTPQMQKFNSPIWLALEDYALDHAREDKMRISVFTGPYLSDDDPERYDVRIPRAFWKVIAFIHDDTGELCATGYEMNQENIIPPDTEFVFDDFVSPQLAMSTQVSIASIERRSGIRFDGLAESDPFRDTRESVGGAGEAELETLEQIRFLPRPKQA